MTKRSILLLPLAAATLAGCNGYRGVESVNQPVVRRVDYTLDVSAGSGGLPTSERMRLAAWFDTLRIGYGDRLSIDDTTVGGSAARRDVASIAGERGLLLAPPAAPLAAPPAPGVLRVTVSRARADVPGCPDHRDVYRPNWGAETSTNYGCAVNTNLAAMVADPMDLVRGQTGTGVSDLQTGNRAVVALRAAKPTGEGGTVLKTEAVGGGK